MKPHSSIVAFFLGFHGHASHPKSHFRCKLFRFMPAPHPGRGDNAQALFCLMYLGGLRLMPEVAFMPCLRCNDGPFRFRGPNRLQDR